MAHPEHGWTTSACRTLEAFTEGKTCRKDPEGRARAFRGREEREYSRLKSHQEQR